MAKPAGLIASIVDNLKEKSPHKRSDVDFIVRWQVDLLKRIIAAPPSWGWAADNLEHAKRVGTLARELQRVLEGAPDGTHLTLLTFGAYASRPQMPDPEEVAASNVVDRFWNLLKAALQDLQKGCAVILDPKNKNRIGDYHTLDRTKHFCAASGFELMVGLEAGQPTNGDPFRSIANSLFEIVAPKEIEARRRKHKDDVDLRTQCQKVLSNWRKNPANLQRHAEELKRTFAGMIAQKSHSSL